jgi:hypothetical protein
LGSPSPPAKQNFKEKELRKCPVRHFECCP